MSRFRRREVTIMGASVLLGAIGANLAGARAADLEPQTLLLKANGWVPNNPRLPLLHYRGVLPGGSGQERTTRLEAMLKENGWPPQWRNGIYTYHHYHSTAHEVLGFAAGTTRVMLGGPNGTEVVAEAGDVVVLPAGTGHARIEATGDYLVIGAYPPGQGFDIRREAPTDAMTRGMAALPFPARDPVAGANGPLTRQWRPS